VLDLGFRRLDRRGRSLGDHGFHRPAPRPEQLLSQSPRTASRAGSQDGEHQLLINGRKLEGIVDRHQVT
jgi:hypothetical protein